MNFQIEFLLFLLSISLLGGLGVVVQSDDNIDDDGNDKKRRRTKEERGLPRPKALESLARTYLETQHRLWPKLVGKEFPAEIDGTTTKRLAAKFRELFLASSVTLFKPTSRRGAWKGVAAAYVRYSCDNSNPRSLDQQLKLALDKAKQENYFIPWEHVFADAAISGTTAERTGYQQAKAATVDDDSQIDVIFIDEIGRASRDMVEAMNLGRLLEANNKLLITVSDGIDMRNPMWKPLLSFFAALQEWFIDQLKQKVNRGLNDAFDEGKTLCDPGFGYNLVPTVDVQGNPIVRKNGRPFNSIVINEDHKKWVLAAFQLYALRKRSPARIAKLFNRFQVQERKTWDGSKIRKLLERHRFVGIRIKGRLKRGRDPLTEKPTTEIRPRSEWKAKRDRSIQIVPWSLWKKTRQRLAECARAYDPFENGIDRTDVYPSMLVRPICGSCGKTLWLGRSGKYGSYCCPNSRRGTNGCTYRGYKSAKIVEDAILGYLKVNVLTEEAVDNLVAMANEFLVSEAAKPKTDLEPVKARIRDTKRSITRVNKAIEIAETDIHIPSLVKRLVVLEKELASDQDELRQEQASNDIPDPLTVDEARLLMSNLRELLKGDVAQAAPVVRQLTGPITVHQVKQKGRKKADWIATFDAEIMPAMLELSRSGNCPTTGKLEHLCTHGWTMPQPAEVTLEEPPAYVVNGPDFLAEHNDGQAIIEIARSRGCHWQGVLESISYAATGLVPDVDNDSGDRTAGWERFKEFGDDVLRFRDVQELSWDKVVQKIQNLLNEKVSINAVLRSYEHAHGRFAGYQKRMHKSSFRHSKKFQEFRELVEGGEQSMVNVAKQLGIAERTAYTWKKRLNGLSGAVKRKG